MSGEGMTITSNHTTPTPLPAHLPAPTESSLPADPSPSTDAPVTAELLAVGTLVEVRSRFDQHWARGFEVASHRGAEYELRRLSDGELLPVDFCSEAVRKERKKSTWWY